MPTNLRHKFVNYSLGSLTAADTRDNFEEEVDQDDASDRSSDSDDNIDDLESDSEFGEPRQWQRKGCSSDEGGSPVSHTVGELPTVVEDTCDEKWEVATDAFSMSCLSERDVDELDDFLNEDLLSQAPLINIVEGIQPHTELPRCPPVAWLRAAGYDVPSSKAFDAAPVAPVCGERPARYLNLFCRQMLARASTSDLTVASLASHTRRVGHSRHVDPMPALPQANANSTTEAPSGLPQNGTWLEAFISKARAVPLHSVAGELLGEEIGHDVAGYLDTFSDGSNADAAIADEDVPNGLNVMGHTVRQKPVHRGRGRAGFYMESDHAISTPGRSQSPPPRRAQPPLLTEPPAPPFIRGPVQPFSARRNHY